jgi:plastocyanin
MFCPACGKQSPDSAEFCSKCGCSIERVTLNPPVRNKPRRRLHLGGWLSLVVFLVAVGWFVSFINSHITHSAAPPAAPANMKAPRLETIASQSITVGAGSFTYYKIVVPEGAAQPYVDGHFTASGGFGNAIQIFVGDTDAFVNFKNGHSSETYFNSGMVTQNSINAILPGPGTYYLVCNNRFSLQASKSVELDAVLHYMN